MNFNDVIKSLGLEKLAASSSAGGGTQARPVPDEGGPESAEAEPPSPDDAESEPDPDPAPKLEEATAAMTDNLETLRHDIDQLSNDINTNSSQLKAVRSEYEEVLDRLDTIEEHNTRLLGVYDRLTAGINPFSEDWNTKYDQTNDRAEKAEHRYGVIVPNEENTPSPADVEQAARDEGAGREDERRDDEDAVDFSDLKERRDADASAADESTADTAAAARPRPETDGWDDQNASQTYLARLDHGYATDVLVMEWLTMLIDIAGSAGALKALDYYESIGWIGRPVKHRMEDTLSGARVPGDTEARPPSDLTTEEHNRSFAYIMKLVQQHHAHPSTA